MFATRLTINAVLQSVVAIAGITAIGEIMAKLSKLTVITYVLVTVLCAVVTHIVTPWNIVLPRADLNGEVMNAYQSAVMSSVVSYSVAFVVSILVGVFSYIERTSSSPVTHKDMNITNKKPNWIYLLN